MSVRRVMGTEIEYGISVPGQPTANPTTLSSQVVNAWAVAEAPTPRRPCCRGPRRAREVWGAARSCH